MRDEQPGELLDIKSIGRTNSETATSDPRGLPHLLAPDSTLPLWLSISGPNQLPPAGRPCGISPDPPETVCSTLPDTHARPPDDTTGLLFSCRTPGMLSRLSLVSTQISDFVMFSVAVSISRSPNESSAEIRASSSFADTRSAVRPQRVNRGQQLQRPQDEGKGHREEAGRGPVLHRDPVSATLFSRHPQEQVSVGLHLGYPPRSRPG